MSSSIHTIHRPVAYSRAISESRTPTLERSNPSYSGNTYTNVTSHASYSFQQNPVQNPTISQAQQEQMYFPVRANIAEKTQARDPALAEQDYQHQTSDHAILRGTKAGENVSPCDEDKNIAREVEEIEREEAEGDRVEEELIRGEGMLPQHFEGMSVQDGPPGSHQKRTRQTDQVYRGEEGDSVGRRKRKQKLAEKLRDVFNLVEVESVVGELPCWLLRSVCEYAF